MSLKLSVAEWCFFKPATREPAAFYREIAGLGYQAAELVKPERYDAARAAGLKLLNRGGPTGWNRRENHERCLGELRTALADAKVNAIPQVLVFSGNREGQADGASIAQCVEGLTQAAPLAAEAGVTLVLEVFNRFDHPDYVCDSSAFAYEVVRAVASPNLRVLYDIYHMLRMGEDVRRTLFDNLELVGHLHLARSPDRRVATDDASLAIAREVAQSPYDGFLGVEWLTDQPIEELGEFMQRLNAGNRR